MADNSIESWKRLYDSIGDPTSFSDTPTITLEESKYFHNFSKLSGNEKMKIMHDKKLEGFYFLNKKKPQFRDIVFTYNALETK